MRRNCGAVAPRAAGSGYGAWRVTPREAGRRPGASRIGAGAVRVTAGRPPAAAAGRPGESDDCGRGSSGRPCQGLPNAAGVMCGRANRPRRGPPWSMTDTLPDVGRQAEGVVEKIAGPAADPRPDARVGEGAGTGGVREPREAAGREPTRRPDLTDRSVHRLLIDRCW